MKAETEGRLKERSKYYLLIKITNDHEKNNICFSANDRNSDVLHERKKLYFYRQ
jgi:hypothetical protein